MANSKKISNDTKQDINISRMDLESPGYQRQDAEERPKPPELRQNSNPTDSFETDSYITDSKSKSPISKSPNIKSR